MVHALAMLPRSYKEANKELTAEHRLTPEQLDLLIKLGYPPVQAELQKNQEAMLELSERAKDNKLFIDFD